MTKAALIVCVGNTVEVEFKDGTTVRGTLEYISKFCGEQGYRKVGYFAIKDYCFKVSHIKKFRTIFAVG